MLIDGLPPDAALHLFGRDPATGLTTDQTLAGLTIESVDHSARQLWALIAAAHGARNPKPWAPIAIIPRPEPAHRFDRHTIRRMFATARRS